RPPDRRVAARLPRLSDSRPSRPSRQPRLTPAVTPPCDSSGTSAITATLPEVYADTAEGWCAGAAFAITCGARTFTRRHTMTIKFVPNAKGTPPGKLADAELHFAGGPLDGLKLIGFSVWERKSGGRNVTFPARQYSMNGERRSYAILRPILDVASQH